MKSCGRVGGFALLLLALSLFFSSHLALTAASPPPSIGQVVWVKGVIKATDATGKSRSLQRRSPIYTKDTIASDKASTGQLVFSDNSLVSISQDTTLRIDEYQFGKNTPPSQAKFVASLVKGGLRTLTGLIPKQNADNYQVNTPVATIGVRGTNYALVFKGQLYVKYFSGKPCVKNGSGTICLDNKNRFSEVASANSAPTRSANDPGVFNDLPEMISADFITGGTISPGSMTPGGSTITPKDNSFCIQ